MNCDWNAHCGLSLVHFLAFPECQSGDGPIWETIERVLLDDFFSGIEITRVNDPATRKAVAQLVEQTHAWVDFGAQPIILSQKLNLNSFDPSERRKAVSALEPYIEQAAELGARRFVLLSGPDPGISKRNDALDLLRVSLRELCEFARTHRISVALETFDREIDKKALVGPVHDAAKLGKEMQEDFKDFGLLYDMGHMVLLGEKPLEALRLLKDYVVHVHVGNCVKVPGRTSYGDSHPRFGFPGGENDIAELVEFQSALFQTGYLLEKPVVGKKPMVGFEVKPQAGESSNAILANVKRSWRAAWNDLRVAPCLSSNR
jgi:sugar phosphate isomerase/epimerase